MWKPSVSTSRMETGVPLVTFTMHLLLGRKVFASQQTLRKIAASVFHVFLLAVWM